MRKICSAMAVIAAVALCVFCAYAQEDAAPGASQKKEEIPPGMEAIKISNSTTLIIPKGAKVYNKEGRVRVENDDHYMARRFEELDKRLATIEKKQDVLDKEIKKINARAVAEPLKEAQKPVAATAQKQAQPTSRIQIAAPTNETKVTQTK